MDMFNYLFGSAELPLNVEKQRVKELLVRLERFIKSRQTLPVYGVGYYFNAPCQKKARDLLQRAEQCGMTDIPDIVIQTAECDGDDLNRD